MFIISKEAQIELIEKKSKFITRAKIVYSEKEAQIAIKEIVNQEKGAVHNCYSYRILQNNNIVERKNDDGEPGGTAGAPMLSVLSSENLVNILVVTTRYFGGIKLGTGGLVHIYKKGVVEVLKLSGKKEFKIFSKYKIILPINEVSHLEYILKKENIKILEKNFSEDVSFIVEIEADFVEKLDKISKTINGKVSEVL